MLLGLLLVAFVVVPLAELALIIEVGSHLGVLNTIGLLLLVSVVGAWVVRRQGLATLQRIRAALGRGVLPGNDVIDGLAIIVAGALLLTPGFLTDAVGLVLLMPPSRALLRGILRRFLVGRIAIREVRFRPEPPAGGEAPPRRPPPHELPPG